MHASGRSQQRAPVTPRRLRLPRGVWPPPWKRRVGRWLDAWHSVPVRAPPTAWMDRAPSFAPFVDHVGKVHTGIAGHPRDELIQPHPGARHAEAVGTLERPLAADMNNVREVPG